jgi:predicted HAD superfamily Cof-like phosphohydrolase
MNKQWQMVREFHEKFSRQSLETPGELSKERVKRRVKWMREELDEFSESKNIYEQADAIIDLMYFALGALVEMGVPPEKIFEAVHDANMAKLWPDGKPRRDNEGKIIKPPGWKEPDLREIINQC